MTAEMASTTPALRQSINRGLAGGRGRRPSLTTTNCASMTLSFPIGPDPSTETPAWQPARS